MIGSLTNHLWQSTAFALGGGLLTVMLRGNQARVRYWVWLCASAKFLIPFSILIGLGSVLPVKPVTPAPQRAVFTAVQVAQPFPEARLAPVHESREWIPEVLAALWACGFVGVVGLRIRGWARVRAAVLASVPAEIVSNVEVRCTPGLLEPGVVGFFRMVLLLPEGIAEKLTPAQLAAVLAHELSHVRRRDNLTGALHMIVEAVFWFYPVVWWIGARMIEERERACDEAVLELGNEPRDYADAILGVVKLYVESPIVCVAGVTGADLKRRIESILSGRAVSGLNAAKKLMLVVASILAVAGPVEIGVLSVRRLVAQRAPVPAPPIVAPVQAQTPSPAPRPVAAPLITAAPLSTERDPNLDWAAMKPIRARYGSPNEIQVTAGGGEIWRYKYLEDFHSNVELEFGRFRGGSVHVNFPPPLATFQGEPALDLAFVNGFLKRPDKGAPVPNAYPGFPGQRASMETYPASVNQRLVVHIELMAGMRMFDVIASVLTQPGGGGPASAVANLSDSLILKPDRDAATARYEGYFALGAGSYLCNVAVMDPTGPIYSEQIHFTVK